MGAIEADEDKITTVIDTDTNTTIDTITTPPKTAFLKSMDDNIDVSSCPSLVVSSSSLLSDNNNSNNDNNNNNNNNDCCNDDLQIDPNEYNELLTVLTNAKSILQESLNNKNIIDDKENEDNVKDALDSISMKCSEKLIIQLTSFDIIYNQLHLVQDIVNILLQYSLNENIITQGLTTIHNTSLDEIIATYYIKECNLFPIIINYMIQYNTNVHIQTRGSGIIGMFLKLSNDSVSTTTILSYITNLNIIQLLLDTLTNFPNEAKLHRWVLKALMIITTLYLNECNTQCIELGIVGIVGISFNMHHTNIEYGTDITKYTWSILGSLLESQSQSASS